MNDIDNFETLFQMMPNYGFIVRQGGRVIAQNTLAGNTFGKDVVYIPFYIKSDSRTSQELFKDIITVALIEPDNLNLVELIDIYGVVRSCELKIKEIQYHSEMCYLVILVDKMEIINSNLKFNKTFELNTIPILISNFETGEFIDVNKAALELFNYTREEVIGRKAYQFIEDASPEFRISYFTELILKGKVEDELDMHEVHTEEEIFELEYVNYFEGEFNCSQLENLILEKVFQRGRALHIALHGTLTHRLFFPDFL